FAEDKMIIFFKDGRTQSFDLNSIQKIEYQTTPGAYQRTTEKGIPVTIYWHMADNADVYLNGVPLRRYEPSFKTRRDEAPQPPFSAGTILKNGDVFTVGGRRGGSYGFMLIAVDSSGQVVFKTDQKAWRVYKPGDRSDWYLPRVALSSPTFPVTVQNNPWPPQVELNRRFNNIASSIWAEPSEHISYLVATVQLEDQRISPTAPQYGINITGTYRCREGLMNFFQTGTTVNGTYNWSGGGVTTGQMVGNDYVGNFRDRGGAGDFRYRFSTDGKSFQMDWRLTGETNFRDGGRCEKVQ
ncbi:MAG: hypothetical protein N2596_08225, partial [Syntrophorhabdaceae bacterium]|nr:hypothetical protein [Syntrophorhabdaceae bacterium]